MPFSFHSHSGQFCKHAFSSLEEIVLQAIASGFTHYGLSEHMPRYRVEDLYEEEVEVSLLTACGLSNSRSFVKKQDLFSWTGQVICQLQLIASTTFALFALFSHSTFHKKCGLFFFY